MMGSRTRRLVFLRLMAVVAIAFMAIGHLLYSMTAGLDGYARLHMAVLTPGATDHNHLERLMSQSVGGLDQRSGKGKGKDKQRASMAGGGCVSASCKAQKLQSPGPGGVQIPRRSYSIQPVDDLKWRQLPFNGIPPSSSSAFSWDADIRSPNGSHLLHVRHCPSLHLHPSLLRTTDTLLSPWQRASRNGDVFLFSAHFDGRSRQHQTRRHHRRRRRRSTDPTPAPAPGVVQRGLVRVMAVGDRLSLHPPAFCQIWYSDDDEDATTADDADATTPQLLGQSVSKSPLVVPATKVLLSDGPGTKDRLAALVYTCELPTSRAPLGVSLVPDACQSPTNYLPVDRPRAAVAAADVAANSVRQSGVGVCLSPLPPHYSDASALLQTIEVNRMFGADHFVVYNQSSDGEVGAQLKSYASDGIVDLVQLPLPPVTSMDSRANQGTSVSAQPLQRALKMAAINDCLYRQMGLARYVAFLGIDEVLVPRRHVKWTDMITDIAPLTGRHGPTKEDAVSTSSVFSFPTAVFSPEVPDDGQYTRDARVRRLRLTSLLKTARSPVLPPPGGERRSVVDACRVETLTSTGVRSLHGRASREAKLAGSVALVHVYPPPGGRRSQGSSVRDRTLLTYYDVIVSRVMERQERLEDAMTYAAKSL